MEKKLISIFKAAVAVRLAVLQYSHTRETHSEIERFINSRNVLMGCGCVDMIQGRDGLHEAVRDWVKSKEKNICEPSRWPGRAAKVGRVAT